MPKPNPMAIVHDKKVAAEYQVVLWLAALGFFMQALDATIVNTALPNIAYSLHVDPLHMHNVVIAYVLTVAVLIPVSGWLADRFGIQRVYFAAIAIFTFASLGCALSQNYTQLIIARIFQGIGGALLLPVGRLALLRILPRTQFLAAMGFIAIPGLVGPLIGPTLGGFMVQYATWHWIFLINLPIGIIGMILTYTHMPNAKLANLPAFDYYGLLLLMLAMVCLTMGLESFSQGTSTGWHILSVLLVGISAIMLYIRHAKTDVRAIFRPVLFEEISFRIGIWGNIVSRLGSASMPFILPLALQLALGFSPFQTGLMMIPLVIGSIVIKRFATFSIQRFGYYRVLFCNTVLVGVGIMSFAALQLHPNLYIQSLHFFLFGCVNSIQFTAMNTLTLKDLNKEQAANGNSLLSMIVNVSMSLGVALVGVLLACFAKFGQAHVAFWSFQMTFILLGLITVAASLIFRRLPRAVLTSAAE